MEVHGPAALAASNFADTLWGYACDHPGFWDTAYAAADHVTACPADESGTVSTAQAEHPGDTAILALGRLGQGIAPDRQRPGASTGVSPTNAKHAACGLIPDDTNTSAAYDAVNPGEVGLRAFVASAQHSIFISQQDLLGLCPPQAHYDVRIFQILAGKIVSGVPVTIVLSNPGAQTTSGIDGYSNGESLNAVSTDLLRYIEQQTGNRERARVDLCRHLQLAPLRTSTDTRWPGVSGKSGLPSLHTKLIVIDRSAFYIGSENLYPAYHQEYGYIVEQRAATDTLERDLVAPEWRYSRVAATIDPDQDRCTT